jgi:hypothetical protein
MCGEEEGQWLLFTHGVLMVELATIERWFPSGYWNSLSK